MSPVPDCPPTEMRLGMRADSAGTPGAFRGTDGSNPVPPSAESAANCASSAEWYPTVSDSHDPCVKPQRGSFVRTDSQGKA